MGEENPLGHSAVRGEGARGRAPRAEDFGWNDSLYDGPEGDGTDADAPAGESAGSDRPAAPASRNGRGPKGLQDPDGSRRDRPRIPRRGKRVLRWTALGLSMLILGTAGAGYLYYEHLNGKLTRKPLNLGGKQLRHGTDAVGRSPVNILLLGSDSRGSQRNVELGGARDDADRKPLADVQMLLHLSADRNSMSVLSIPRDTKVTIPECTDPEDGTVYPQSVDKINSSLQHGGPGCTVATWMELTGIPIDHFMMIDFAGVVDMADAIGGVPVCVDANVHDRRSGLRLEKGTTTVTGEQALQWLRTRHGFEDGSDIGRARAQHMYMTSMVRQLKAGTKLTDPGKLRSLAEAATKALTVDEGIDTVKDLYDLANELKQVPTDRITMATMPWEYSDGGSYVVPKPGEAEEVFSLIRDDIALDGKDANSKKSAEKRTEDPAAPSDRIPVRVRNGTGSTTLAPVNGRAAVLTNRLHRLGFTRATADPTSVSQANTTLSYADEDRRGDALAVAKALGLPERAVRHSADAEGITLVIGADWRAGATYPRTKEAAEDRGASESTRAPNGGNTEACMRVNRGFTW